MIRKAKSLIWFKKKKPENWFTFVNNFKSNLKLTPIKLKINI